MRHVMSSRLPPLSWILVSMRHPFKSRSSMLILKISYVLFWSPLSFCLCRVSSLGELTTSDSIRYPRRLQRRHVLHTSHVTRFWHIAQPCFSCANVFRISRLFAINTRHLVRLGFSWFQMAQAVKRHSCLPTVCKRETEQEGERRKRKVFQNGVCT